MPPARTSPIAAEPMIRGHQPLRSSRKNLFVSTPPSPSRPARSRTNLSRFSRNSRQISAGSSSAALQTRVEEVPERIAEHVEAEHGKGQGDGRPDGEPGRLVHVIE